MSKICVMSRRKMPENELNLCKRTHRALEIRIGRNAVFFPGSMKWLRDCLAKILRIYEMKNSEFFLQFFIKGCPKKEIKNLSLPSIEFLITFNKNVSRSWVHRIGNFE